MDLSKGVARSCNAARRHARDARRGPQDRPYLGRLYFGTLKWKRRHPGRRRGAAVLNLGLREEEEALDSGAVRSREEEGATAGSPLPQGGGGGAGYGFGGALREEEESTACNDWPREEEGPFASHVGHRGPEWGGGTLREEEESTAEYETSGRRRRPSHGLGVQPGVGSVLPSGRRRRTAPVTIGPGRRRGLSHLVWASGARILWRHPQGGGEGTADFRGSGRRRSLRKRISCRRRRLAPRG